MNSRSEDFIIVCATDKGTSSEEVLLNLRSTFIQASPDYWEFINPGTFVAYFCLRKSGESRSQRLTSRLSDLIPGGSDSAEFGWGRAMGRLIAAFDEDDHVTTAPLGNAVNEAMKLARNK
jgi:hypothetical protein